MTTKPKRPHGRAWWDRARWPGFLPFFFQAPGDIGLQGERLACRELERRGYHILERRVRSRLGEIDVVAWDGPVLAFVEVKTRTGTGFGTPEEAVGRRKQRRMARLAHGYLAMRRLSGTTVRFDVVAVQWGTGRRPRVEVIRGAFEET